MTMLMGFAATALAAWLALGCLDAATRRPAASAPVSRRLTYRQAQQAAAWLGGAARGDDEL
jgi:hypothetical protein